MANFAARSNQMYRSVRPRLASSPTTIASKRHMQLVPALETTVPKKHIEGGLLIPAGRHRHGLDVNTRLERFTELYEFVQGGIGAKRAFPSRGIRSTSWKNLIQLSTTAAQLEKIAEMFPKWREMQRSFDEQDSELFIRRCEELDCAPLALRVFSDHSKYGFPLTSHKGALHLLHSLHLKHPLHDTTTASALLKVYGHPGTTESIPACAMMVTACFKHGSTDPRAKELGAVLLPVLRTLCEQTQPHDLDKVVFMGDGTAAGSWKPRLWTLGALKRIERYMTQDGKGVKWVRHFRRKFSKNAIGLVAKEVEESTVANAQTAHVGAVVS